MQEMNQGLASDKAKRVELLKFFVDVLEHVPEETAIAERLEEFADRKVRIE